jgi:hypothetical protein
MAPKGLVEQFFHVLDAALKIHLPAEILLVQIDI